jgi:hypothetical protein
MRVSVSASLKDTERVCVFALALTLTLFQPIFAKTSAKASVFEEGLGGQCTPKGQKLQPV